MNDNILSVTFKNIILNSAITIYNLQIGDYSGLTFDHMYQHLALY